MNTAIDKVPAAIIGLGWWGRKIAELVQARSDRLRFVHAVEPNAAAVSDVADKRHRAISLVRRRAGGSGGRSRRSCHTAQPARIPNRASGGGRQAYFLREAAGFD